MKKYPICENDVNKITRKYGVWCCKVDYNIQGTCDILLDQNIYYKSQERMAKEIRKLGNINDIFYKDII